MTNLPKHIQALTKKLNDQDAALEKMGITPIHKILKAQKKAMDANPFHPLHGLAKF